MNRPRGWSESRFMHARMQSVLSSTKGDSHTVIVASDDQPLLVADAATGDGTNGTIYAIRRIYWLLKLRMSRDQEAEPRWRVGVFGGPKRTWEWASATDVQSGLTLDQACKQAEVLATRYMS